MSLNPQWQKAISRLPPGEFAEGGFWSHLEQALKLMNNDKNSAPQRQHGARDILYLFKAFVAYSLRDRKRPDHLLMSYRALLPIINEHAGVTWAKLALDELDAEEVDLVLDAARRLTIER